MLLSTGRLTLLAALVAGLLAAGAHAQSSGVRDSASLFKPDTLRKANEQIEQIQTIYRVPVTIETVGALSNEQNKAREKLKKPAERERFYTELVEKRARESGADGIYVWIVKSPPRAEVVFGAEVSEEKWTPRARKELRDRLARLGKQKLDNHADQELLGIIETVRKNLEAAGHPAIWPWVLAIVGGVLALWVIISLFRSKESVERSAEEPAPSPLSGGMLGGMMLGQAPVLGKKSPSLPDLPATTPPALPENQVMADAVEEEDEFAGAPWRKLDNLPQRGE